MNSISSKIYFLTLLIFAFSSCSKIKIRTAEDKLYGEWTFEKASFYKNGSLRCQEKIQEFDESSIFFKNDGTLTLDDRDKGFYYEGTWTLEQDWGEEGSSFYYMEMQLVDTASNDTFTEYWDEMNIRKSAIDFRQESDEGHYNFKIIKQQ